MGVLNLTTPDRDGTVTSGAAVAASDTIPKSKLGTRGVILEIINGNASPDTVTITDATKTSTDAPAAAISKSVTNGTSQAFKILPQQADPVSGDVTITHTQTTTVTYKLYPRD